MSDDERALPRLRMELVPIQSVKPSSPYLQALNEILLSEFLEGESDIPNATLKYITLQFLQLIICNKDKTQAMMRSRHNRQTNKQKS